MYPKQFWNEFRIVDYPDQIFVGMWFKKENIQKRYDEVIKKAIEQTELKPLFLADMITGDSIPIDIMKGIIECKLVLFDISPMDSNPKNRNPNVMYEIGLAHTWRNKEEVLLVADDVRDLPFDIQSMGVEQYSLQDKEQAIENIASTVVFRLQEIEKIYRSKVIKAALSLTIDAFKILVEPKGKVFVVKGDEPILYLDALSLLLNLGLVEFLTDIKPDVKEGYKGGYGYHPTQLGREVIKYFEHPLLESDLKEKYPSLYKMKYGIKD
ncbi:hypothetical protein ACFL2Y_01140 [Candidatus Omnitrophota bacterium]